MILPLKPFRLTIYLIVLVSLYIIVVSIANYLSDDGSDHYIYKLGEHTFSIPKTYYRNRRNNTEKFTSTRLALILPDMLPFSEKTRSEFEKLGYHNQIFIDVMERDGNPTVLGSFESFIKHGGYTKIGKSEYDGLILYQNQKYDFQSDLYIPSLNEEGNLKIFFLCKKYQEGKSPHCKGNIDYSESLIVQYTFSRDYIIQWRKIDRDVRELLKSFEVVK